MDKRDDVLREALKKNDEEISRWKRYQEENDTAVENLDKFSKNLTVDVMVPIGQKAYMPGKLIHTNEVLVGHYQGYFSKCTSYKAKDICKHRIKMATETLDKLKAELDLWQNKLEKPYTEGVFPSMQNHEIIEDYDEAKERIWREKHKLLVKKAKLREKSEREQDLKYADRTKLETKNEFEIFQMLEEAELMEELENELENLQIDEVSNEMIRKLMGGEMKLPPSKPREAATKINFDGPHKWYIEQNADKVSNTDGLGIQGIVKKSDLAVNALRTNNNNFLNPEFLLANNNIDERNDFIEELPQEIEIIKEQAKYLSALDQMDFYEFQIKIMRQKLLTLPLKTQEDLNQKVHILKILETLEELLEMAEDSAEAQEEEDNIKEHEIMPADVEKNEISVNQGPKKEKQQKRRISFALQDEAIEFRRNETVSEMLPKPQPQKLEKDIIKLDEEAISPHRNKTPIKAVDRKQNILNKVEQNLKFIEETQSTRDFKLVDTILEPNVGICHTLHIHFQHSDAPGMEESRMNENFKSDHVPGSPADFNQLYLKSINNQAAKKYNSIADQVIYTNSYVGEDKVKVPLLKETDRLKAYEDRRLEFCKSLTETKSILRNKSSLEREQHNLERKNIPASEKKSTKKNNTVQFKEEDYMSAYYKVMNEVVEKPLCEPEPLPDCKYIDAHTPKKRISRFKQVRGGTENK
ncbi:unconventional prefoldin RPB5 interactor-like protein [Eurosta solidaginis]|uniref:unconventional prefoldin RPB5 interactor-like protein n=1 Tax=Eurosta solidaginis TaxID=178769 RepID=UPI00353066F8